MNYHCIKLKNRRVFLNLNLDDQYSILFKQLIPKDDIEKYKKLYPTKIFNDKILVTHLVLSKEAMDSLVKLYKFENSFFNKIQRLIQRLVSKYMKKYITFFLYYIENNKY